MKRYVIFLICLTATIAVFGQNETIQINRDVEEVKVTPPKFTGVLNADKLYDAGKSSAIKNYLAKNFVCPNSAAECNKEGTEIIQFTVTPDGRLTKFKVVNSVCKEIDKEMIRVLKNTNGMWVPGQNNGKPATMEHEVSMLFGNYTQDEIVNHFVEQAEKYHTMGSSKLIVEQRPKKALKYYNSGIRYLPNDKGLLLLRGICNYELGNEEEAKRDWNRIVSLGGTDHALNYEELVEMKGYKEMTRILAKK
jgi:tetratricopeptide (TPR) repeat protein